MVIIKGVCLLHKKGMECPLVGSDWHCGSKPCHLEHDNPFIQDKEEPKIEMLKAQADAEGESQAKDAREEEINREEESRYG